VSIFPRALFNEQVLQQTQGHAQTELQFAREGMTQDQAALYGSPSRSVDGGAAGVGEWQEPSELLHIPHPLSPDAHELYRNSPAQQAVRTQQSPPLQEHTHPVLPSKKPVLGWLEHALVVLVVVVVLAVVVGAVVDVEVVFGRLRLGLELALAGGGRGEAQTTCSARALHAVLEQAAAGGVKLEDTFSGAGGMREGVDAEFQHRSTGELGLKSTVINVLQPPPTHTSPEGGGASGGGSGFITGRGEGGRGGGEEGGGGSLQRSSGTGSSLIAKTVKYTVRVGGGIAAFLLIDAALFA
jgi:hypothetical protein